MAYDEMTALMLRENERFKEALREIALAGMSGTGQESEEAMLAWHARRAWEFIGIAARALSPASPEGRASTEPAEDQQ